MNIMYNDNILDRFYILQALTEINNIQNKIILMSIKIDTK
jgi:hypothetical protein